MAHPFHYYRTVLAAAVGALGVGFVPARPAAQARQPSAVIAGRVVDHQSHTPISQARILLVGTPRNTDSDSVGRFSHAGLASGTYIVQVRAVGYSMATWVIRLSGSQVVEQDFEVEPLAILITGVTVEAPPGVMQRRMIEFERRRASGRGVFITQDQIRQTNPATLNDLLRSVAGVEMACNSAGCNVRMTRSARGACRPEFVLDGFPASYSTTTNLPTVGIVGVEVYRSHSEAPSEFLKADTNCGVIVIWTRSAPGP
jgi:hypothetical protein